MELCTTGENHSDTIRFWLAMGFEIEWRPAYKEEWKRSIVHEGDFSGLTVPRCYYRIKPKQKE